MNIIKAGILGILLILFTGCGDSEDSSNNTQDNTLTSINELTIFNGKIYFAGSNHTNGTELWVSDGTISGTRMLEDAAPGYESLFPIGIKDLNNQLIFWGHSNNGTHGLWRSDGREGGTVFLKDFSYRTERGTIAPGSFFEFNDALYFRAPGDGKGSALWKTDGTVSGTVKVKDLSTNMIYGSGYISMTNTFTIVRNMLYFAEGSGKKQAKLWRSDGTEAGTVALRVFSLENTSPADFIAFKDSLFFSADENITMGDELWKVSGHSSIEIFDLNKDNSSSHKNSYPHNMYVHDGKMFFSAYSNTGGYDLWVSDGSKAGTVTLKDIPGIGTQGYYLNFFEMDQKLYFYAKDENGTISTWTTDGTTAGTVKIAKKIPRADFYDSTTKTAYYKNYDMNNSVYSVGDVTLRPVCPNCPVKMNGEIIRLDGVFYFESYRPDALWRTDGTEEGTWKVK